MKRLHLTLTQRLGALIALLLLVSGAFSVTLQIRTSGLQAEEAIQRLSVNLAGQIAANNQALLLPEGFNDEAVRTLFDRLMGVNPSVEVYLLEPNGRIAAHAAPPGSLRRDRVAVSPLQALRRGEPLPIWGDDPRSESGTKVFSAAPLLVQGQERGWIYVVLIGQAHETQTRRLFGGGVLRTSLWVLTVVALLCLVAGVLAMHWVTRPLRELTAEVGRLSPGRDGSEPTMLASPQPTGLPDEIAQLRQAFADMAQRLSDQWQALSAQDQQRREMVANISHDLRTPLTSLHGYLETLRLKDDVLSPIDRRRYLDTAISQSRKVGTLAQALFELARLEHGGIKLEREPFSLGELVQDVFQKFELAAEARHQRLIAEVSPSLPAVDADLGMIERVLTNLLDNAVRHAPEGGTIIVRVRGAASAVEVSVSDDGPGVPDALREYLFQRPAGRIGWRYGPEVTGGLGLLIVRRILQLHGSDISLGESSTSGARFQFSLQVV